MKRIEVFEVGEEVLVKGKVVSLAIDDEGDMMYQVITTDNGKNMNVWLKNDQLQPIPQES